MTTYFHFTSVRLAPGSVIEPGNYGRVIRCYPHDGQAANGWKLAVELAFESQRLVMDRELPSRLDSCFVFEDVHQAHAMKASMGFHFNLLYEVELVDANARVHRADLGLINACYRSEPNRLFWDKVHDAACSYWSGAIGTIPELLTLSPIRILREVT